MCASLLSLHTFLNMLNKHILYISYDGMTDPLGQSQVIPYLIGLSNFGYRITVLSCEKSIKFKNQGATIYDLLKKNNIQWEYIFFTTSPPIISKYYDLFKLKRKATGVYKTQPFTLVHCRSYVAAAVGLYLKKKYAVKFLFDMRGFWVNERVDGGLWNLTNPIYKQAYKIYKKKEANYISIADGIVSLTQNGKHELKKWVSYKGTAIDVIPCCADYLLFSLQTQKEQEEMKVNLGFEKDDFVLSYVGSIGTWYMLDEMLDFFQLLQRQRSSVKFLFVSTDETTTILSAAYKKGISFSDVKIVAATREEVPKCIKASTVSICFIKPAYSKKSSSPTKLAELLAMGIPIICNTKIGDVEEIITSTKGGLLVADFSEDSYKKVLVELSHFLLNYSPAEVRERSKKYYDLQHGVEQYTNIYRRLNA